MAARFAFLVHALSPLHRGAIGVRGARAGLIFQRADGSAPEDITPICSLRLKGVAVEGVVVAIPMTPAQMLADQQLALERMVAAVASLGAVDAVGLGSLCAVVAGRGEALAERVSVPITTGGAATAWALAANVRALLHAAPGASPAGGASPASVAIVGSRSPVGRAVGQLLSAEGIPLRLDSVRAARGLAGATGFASPEAAVAGCALVVGAGPTGGTLDAAAVASGARIVDVAIPATARPDGGGTLPTGVQVFSGEAVRTPRGWQPGLWGRAYHLLAGYGMSQVYACLLEPLIMATLQRTAPFAQGRDLAIEDVRILGEEASRLGFTPLLLAERGWRRWF